MFQKAITVLFIFFIYFKTFAIDYSFSGARSLALANASTTLHDLWSANNNQAGLAYVKQFQIGFSYENKFGLTELGVKNFNAAIPQKFGTFGISIQQFGFTDYNENKFGIAYGMHLSKQVSIGIQIDYLLVSIAETQTSNKDAFTAEIGLITQLTEKLKLGAHLFNAPNTSLSGSFAEKVPMILRIGLNYQFSDKLLAVLDIEKNLSLGPHLKPAIEYHPIDMLYLRTGINIISGKNEVKISGGIGLKLKSFILDFAFAHQMYLGYLSQISLSYRFGKK